MSIGVQEQGIVKTGSDAICLCKKRVYVGTGNFPAGWNHVVFNPPPARDRQMQSFLPSAGRRERYRYNRYVRFRRREVGTDHFVGEVGERADITIMSVILSAEQID